MTDEVTLGEYLREHIPYELAMLKATYERYKNFSEIKDDVYCNIIIVAFCTHARNLKSFVTNHGKANCVKARDFVSEFSEPIVNNLTGAFQRINEQVDHLAKNRVGGRKFNLSDADSVVAWIDSAMVRFVKALSDDQRKLWNQPGSVRIRTPAFSTSSDYSQSISTFIGDPGSKAKSR